MRHLGMTVVLVAAVLAWGGPARGAEIKDLLSGRIHPLSLQVKDLDGEWCRFTPGGQAESGNWTMMIYAAALGRGGGAYYTKGETVSIGTETYLVAYGRRTAEADLMTLMQRGPEAAKPEPLTEETPLSLSLLNLRTMGSLTDIRVFDLEEELAVSQQVVAKRSTLDSLSNLKNLGLAVQMFLADNHDVMPDMTDAVAVLEELGEYVKNDDVFFHPETGEPYGVNSSLSRRRLVDFGYPTSIAVFYEESPAEDGTRGVAFLDGHAARVSAGKWRRIKAPSGIQ